VSWHYLQGLEVVSSEDIYWDGAAFAPSKSKTTLGAYSLLDSETVCSLDSPSGTTSPHSTGTHGAGESTLSAADSRVRTSAQPEKEQASRESDQGFGLTWPASSARFDRDSRSWKIHPCLFDEDSIPCSVTLPRWGTMRDGELSARTMPVHLISGTESGLWPTIRSTDGERGGRGDLIQSVRGNPNSHYVLWPTPNVPNGGRRVPAHAEIKGGQTPTAYLNGKKCQVGLEQAVAWWPTPTVSDSKARATPSVTARRREIGKQIALEAEVKETNPTGGSLNPTWVELLMGWPENWTCLEPISHVKYIQWLMEFCYDEKRRISEALRVLWLGNAQEEIREEVGRPVSLCEAAILLSLLCEHKNRPDQARIFMACAEVFEGEVRGVRPSTPVASASPESRHSGQFAREHSDLVQALPRFLAHFGKEAWKGDSWENAVPRVAQSVAARVDRLKAIGNGQVPAVVKLAWEVLS
jgi:hypothetical protein